jgi:hypothetical protein
MDRQVLDKPVDADGVPTQTIANTSIAIPLKPLEVYILLDELENGVANDSGTREDLIDYLLDTLHWLGLPDTREEFEEQYYIPPENEQYKRVTMWLDAEKEDK